MSKAEYRMPNAECPIASADRRKAVWGARITGGAALVVGVALLLAGCNQIRQSQTSSYLILTQLTGTNGCGGSSGSGTVMESDVKCLINNVPTIVNDPGSAVFQLAMKDVNGLAPTDNNAITLTQYHVEYVRSDRPNAQQGVDVPYAFDGALTATVPPTASVAFTLVRVQAKQEAPLAAIAVNNIPLTVIAKVTFYGHDQTGRQVSVTGNIEITFANFSG
jgi:hypothetical protein